MITKINSNIYFGSSLISESKPSTAISSSTNPVPVTNLPVAKKTDVKKTDKKDTFEKQSGKKSKKSKILSVALPIAAFAAGSILTRALLENRISNAFSKKFSAEDKYYTLVRDVKNLVTKKTKESVTVYTKENNDLRNKLNIAIENKTQGEFDENLYKLSKQEIDNYKLDYNPIDVSLYHKTEGYNCSHYNLSDDLAPTTNRIKIKELNIPDFDKGMNSWHFKLPESNIIKVTKSKLVNFEPIQGRETSVSMDYAKSVRWDNNKVVRDILQNFYDGHGQTLDGVDFLIEKQKGETYKVKISGKSVFTPDKAIYLGETSKRENEKAAGNYGEGLKMAVLKILKDYNADNVKVGSGDWQVVFNSGVGSIEGKKILKYSLNKVPFLDGNYFEFQTDNIDLLKSIKSGLNNFYHSSNLDFRCPNAENKFFGIKSLPKQKGSVYITGQKFEYNNSWNGIDNATIFFKEKCPVRGRLGSENNAVIFDPSRDRGSLNYDDLKKITQYFASSYDLKEEDLGRSIKALESTWTDLESRHADKAILEGLIDASKHKFSFEFPEKCLAAPFYTPLPEDVARDLKEDGYKICNPDFLYLGMKSVSDHQKEARNHGFLEPTETEIKKIAIIKKAVQQFRPYLEKNGEFSTVELNPKIYLFNNSGKGEEESYKSVLAEAILDDTGSVGFWVDRKTLSTSSFSKMVSTALHEISHKAGGDSTSDFSYKLTDVLDNIVDAFTVDKHTNIEMTNLNKIWNEISAAEKTQK